MGFQNYTQGCIANATCQSQLLNIDYRSSVSVYTLSTVATTFQLSIEGQGIINQALNTNGFAATVTSWSWF
jgi:glucan 1,3-beta-glucosidase